MNTCGSVLKYWRKIRKISQLHLALDIGYSTKHLSFVENGKILPSRKLILHLDQFLLLPRIELNTVLYLAGYAPKYKTLSTSHHDFKPVLTAINTIIENHLPYPAFAFNKNWDVIAVNSAMTHLLEKLGISHHQNLIEALLSTSFKREQIINFSEVLNHLKARIQNELIYGGDNPRLRSLENKLISCLSAFDIEENRDTVLSTLFQLENIILDLFSTITEFGAVQDVNIGEYKVELMFPIDKKTGDYFKALKLTKG